MSKLIDVDFCSDLVGRNAGLHQFSDFVVHVDKTSKGKVELGFRCIDPLRVWIWMIHDFTEIPIRIDRAHFDGRHVFHHVNVNNRRFIRCHSFPHVRRGGEVLEADDIVCRDVCEIPLPGADVGKALGNGFDRRRVNGSPVLAFAAIDLPPDAAISGKAAREPEEAGHDGLPFPGTCPQAMLLQPRAELSGHEIRPPPEKTNQVADHAAHDEGHDRDRDKGNGTFDRSLHADSLSGAPSPAKGVVGAES